MTIELVVQGFQFTVLSNHVQSFHVLYKEILGYNGAYRVGFDGSVETRIVPVGWNKYIIGTQKDWRPLNPGIHNSGYPQIILYKDGKRKTAKVHQLVAHYFIGPCPPGLEVCHEDGNPSNCHVCNLRYDTHQSNYADRIKHGTDSRGERCYNAFLTWEIVDKMRAEYAAGGVLQKTLAVRYNVSRSRVCGIVNNTTWVRS